MKKITLKKLILTNFKGIRALEVDFNQETSISGDNGTGKTSIFDAFTWLLFGKDSHDAKDFNIKTLQVDGKPHQQLEHSVYGMIEVDGSPVELKRIYKEKWTKKRGEETAEFTGHETQYFYNNVPCQQAEYNGYIKDILPEELAKVITNPLHFNNIKWETRRALLSKMAGEISKDELTQGNPEFIQLIKDLGGKTLEQYKREIAAKKAPIRKELDAIPTRIDEADKSKPEVLEWKDLQGKIDLNQKEISAIDEQLQDSSKANSAQLDKIRQQQGEKHSLQADLEKLQRDQNREVKTVNNEIANSLNIAKRNKENALVSINNSADAIKRLTGFIEAKETAKEELVKKWTAKNAETLIVKPEDICCPACKRDYEEATIDEVKASLLSNFNTAKAKALKQIEDEGNAIKSDIEKFKAEIAELEKSIEGARFSVDGYGVEIDELQAKADAPKTNPAPTDAMIAIQKEIDAFVIDTIEQPDNTALTTRKAELNKDLTYLRVQMGTKDQIERADKRIEELKAQQKQLAQELATLEKTEFVINAFNKASIEAVENKVNSMFTLVKFKMYEEQINGGESETCECTVNGVPFSDLNTASKINAGLDIINTVCRFNKISAPIFIDNRESVVTLLPCESQIINLIVNENYKTLKVA